jgi:lysozyme
MTDITTASPALIPFTERQEGKVHKAYRDAGGVVTIGIGFTSLSKTFDAWWKAAKGHALRMGDTITDAECDLLLGMLIAKEYAPPVAKRFAGTGIKQHQFDAATDLCFNCGAGLLKWKWATSLAARDVSAAAALLRTTAVTAGGKKLTGLVRRRADEARLMENADYGTGAASISTVSDEVKAYQKQLVTLGLYSGPVDGIAGTATIVAVRGFQRANGMVVDGKVGPATRAALARAVEARQAVTVGTATTGGGAVAGVGSEAAQHAGQIDWPTLLMAAEWGLAIAVVVLVLFMLWRNRGVILGKRTAA